jgi:hypothetical protein
VSLHDAMLGLMKPTEFWRWYTPHPHRPGKLVATRHRMTEEQALASYPGATRVPGTVEVRDLAETEQELQGLDSGLWAQKSARPACPKDKTAD